MSAGSQSFAVWVTGRPAAGKSLLTTGLVKALQDRGVRPVVLESDVMRRILTPEPTYTEAERDRFYRTLGDLAALLVGQGVPVILDATANRRVWREAARQRIRPFVEVYVDTPTEVCAQRDPKGIYAAAVEGRAAHVPGVQTPYEAPVAPEVTIPDGTSPEEAVSQVVRLLAERGLVPRA